MEENMLRFLWQKMHAFFGRMLFAFYVNEMCLVYGRAYAV